MRVSRKRVVVGLRGAIPAHGVSNAEVVSYLEDLLREAKAGAVTGVAVAWIGPAQSVNTSWSSGMADRHDMVAAAAILQFKITRACLDG
jgi:hypothetical protein